MAVHAFVDESCRGRQYLVAVALVDVRLLTAARTSLRALLLPGQRELHFKHESDRRRRLIADRLARLPGVTVEVYVDARDRGDELARQRCLRRLAEDLAVRDVSRLVLDTREQRDERDVRTIRDVLGRRPRETGLRYEHVPSESESLLWIADVVAWCHGRGGDWRRRVKPLMERTVRLDL